ncbi:MAG: IS481 family transposase [bacterium]|nr:IS481 family transposase [bacterium]
MTQEDLIYKHRLKVFCDYDTGEYTVTSLCKKHNYSRTWFYKFKERRERLGDEGLRPMARKHPEMPNQVPVDIEYKILDYAKEFPTHGPERISNQLSMERYGSIKVGHTGVYGVLSRQDLNTRKKRLQWIQELSGVVVNISQIERDKEKSKSRHIEASYPGELVGVDIFYVGCLKGVGRIYQQTACDCFSSFGWAKLYLDKTADSTIDFLEKHLLPKSGWVRIQRLLQDNGKEYTTHWLNGKHKFKDACKRNKVKQVFTKVRHPWTNGYAERFNQTLLDEFYQVVFRKKVYPSLEELQKDLDKFLYEYNFERTHQGYKLKENGYKRPAEGFFSGKTCAMLLYQKAA